jgi:hypothetical protein
MMEFASRWFCSAGVPPAIYVRVSRHQTASETPALPPPTGERIEMTFGILEERFHV